MATDRTARIVTLCHLGVLAPNYGAEFGPEQLRATATRAERLGFDGLWVTDHVAVPTTLATTYGNIGEALVTLGFLAGVTSRITLGVSALVVPQRQLLLALKQVMTVQQLARGRLIVASAAGWAEQEFANLGARMATRGRQLRAWRALVRRVAEIGSGRVDLAAPGLEITDATISPGFVGGVPPQMWVAGHAEAVLERAAEAGVWHPVGRSLRVLSELADRFHERRPDGRIVLRVAVTISAAADPDALDSGGRCRIEGPVPFVLDAMMGFRRAGVDGFVVDLLRGPQPLGERLDEFASSLAPALQA